MKAEIDSHRPKSISTQRAPLTYERPFADPLLDFGIIVYLGTAFVGDCFSAAHRGACAGDDDGGSSIPGDCLDAHTFAGGSHPNLSPGGYVCGDHTDRVTRLVRPYERAFASRVQQLFFSRLVDKGCSRVVSQAESHGSTRSVSAQCQAVILSALKPPIRSTADHSVASS